MVHQKNLVGEFLVGKGGTGTDHDNHLAFNEIQTVLSRYGLPCVPKSLSLSYVNQGKTPIDRRDRKCDSSGVLEIC